MVDVHDARREELLLAVNPSTVVKRIHYGARWYRFCPTGWLVDVDGGHVVVVDSMEMEGLCEASEICC